MRARLLQALDALAARVDADAAVVWRARTTHDHGVVLLAAPDSLVDEGTVWPTSYAGGGAMARSGRELAQVVPSSIRLRLRDGVRAAWVDGLGDKGLRLLLIWGHSEPPDDAREQILAACESGLAELADDWYVWRTTQVDQMRLEAVLASLDQAVITIDDMRERAHLNAAAGRLLGLPQGEHAASTVSGAMADLQSRVLNQQAARDVGLRIARDPVARIHRTVWEFAAAPTNLAVTSTPIIGDGTTGRVWVFDDVSSHFDLVRQAEQARRAQAEADERFRSAMQGAAIGMCLVAPEGTLLEVNEAMCRMFRSSEDGLLQVRWPDLAHPEDVDAGLTFRDRALAGQISTYRRRQRCLRFDGTVFWVDVASSCVRNEDGTVRYFIDHLTDITAELAAQQELAQSEARLRAVSDSMLDPQVLVTAVRGDDDQVVDLRYEDVNIAAMAYLQMAREDLLASTVLRTFPGVVESGLWSHFVHTLDTGEPLVLQDFLYDNDVLQSQFRYDIQGARVADGLSIIWRDVTDRYNAAARIAESEEHFRLLAENTSDVVILLQHWKIAWISPSVETTLGVAPAHWIGRNPVDIVHPDDVERLTTLVAETQPEQSSVLRLRVQVGDGYHWMDMNVSHYRDAAGRPAGFIASGRLADDQVAAEAALERLARYDSLTGLLNRGSALEHLEHIIHAERRTHGTDVGLLFCDIDFFKGINDSFGHAIGDLVLTTMAERLQSNVRTDDIVARMGGDELLVILPHVGGISDAVAVAEKVRQAARQPIDTGSQSIQVTLSIGAAIAHHGESMEALLVRADTAMYRAKQAGRDRVTALDNP